MNRRHLGRALGALMLLALVGAGASLACSSVRSPIPTPAALRVEPPVRATRHAVVHGALEKLAIAPFESGLALSRGAADAGEAAPPRRVARFLAEGLGGQGFRVVSAGELASGLQLDGSTSLDALAVARRASEAFGATGVLVGRVSRYRERQGGPLSVTEPASVGFEVHLHAAPSGRRLWSGTFSETQQSSDRQPLRAARYPGGGLRWLSAEELARWGAGEMAKSLAALR